MSVEGCLHQFTRSAYSGGMVQVFRERFEGPGELSYGDVNSMYAWAMLGHMPSELVFVREGHVSLKELAGLGYLGFIKCEVEIPPSEYLPPLPYRHKGKLLFPVGRFSGTWTSEELLTLSKVNGRITEIHQSVWFRGTKVFQPYVDFWYAYRQTGNDPAKSAIGKQYLTNLYGKFGQNSERERLWFFPTDEEFAEHELTPIPNASPQMGAYVEKTEATPPYVIPHIAAWITARARVRLWSLMFGYLSQGYRIYYCDTDSIVTDAPIQSSPALGDLKLECQVKRAWFVAPKMYYLEKLDKSETVKAKGFSGGFGKKGLTEGEFRALVSHEAKVRISRMRKLREGVRSKERFPAMKRNMKGLRVGVLDEKRVHLPNGDTRPFDVKELR